jgi:hypothetical protein
MALNLIFLIVTHVVSLLGLSRREEWWKDAEILMLRHQLALAQREWPRAHSHLTWLDRAWLALLAGTAPAERLAAMRLIVTPGTILRWHRDIVRRRWARWPRRGRSERPATRRDRPGWPEFLRSQVQGILALDFFTAIPSMARRSTSWPSSSTAPAASGSSEPPSIRSCTARKLGLVS